jgi:carbon monoxide dehydrogenase subunit G
MPYETTVPVHRRLLWQAVTDAGRLVDALPGAVVEAAEGPGVAGRLRMRVQGQSVTFHGVARIVEVSASALTVTVELEAAFGRGTGAVDGVLTITLRKAQEGTRVTVRPDFQIDGDLPWSGPVLETAVQRVVDRWFAGFAAVPSPTAEPERPVVEHDAAQAAQAERARLAAVPDLETGGPDSPGDGGDPAGPAVSREHVRHQAALRLVPAPTDRDGADGSDDGGDREASDEDGDDVRPGRAAVPVVAAVQPQTRYPADESAVTEPEPEPEHDLWSRTPLVARISRWIPAALAAGVALVLIAVGTAVRGRTRRARR